MPVSSGRWPGMRSDATGSPTATARQNRPISRVTRPGIAFASCRTAGTPHQRAATTLARDVAANGEHNLDSLLSDQPPDRSNGSDQTDQLDQLVETTTLKPSCANGCQGNAFGDQLRLETVGHAKPTHLPAVRQGFRDGKRWEEMPPVPLAAIRSLVMTADVPPSAT